MMEHQQGPLTRFLRFVSSVKFGLILIGLLGAATIAGTLILQRPMAKEGQIEQIYAPQTIRLLDALGLFDVFHASWFLILLGLLGANIVLASLERFPQAWRYFSRPHREADEWFVRKLPVVREIPVGPLEPNLALATVAAAFRKMHFRPHAPTLAKGKLYVEKHRIARLAPYVVHSSLIIIFAGAIVDGVWGFKGYVSLGPGTSVRSVDPSGSTGVSHPLPFTLRCEGAGMEQYADGSPKQYWTKLVVEEDGREVMRKRIHVNEPLTYKGIRFFQSGYGSTGTPARVEVEASWLDSPKPAEKLTLKPQEPVRLSDGTEIQLANFVPDFVLQGNRISSRSDNPNNPAVQLALTRPDGSQVSVWFFAASPQMNYPSDPGIRFRLSEVEMGYFSGLQVAKQPGKGLIWGGCLILSLGLILALYMVHIRLWGVVTRNAKGQPVLLLGGQPNKYRHSFEEQFKKLADAVEVELRAQAKSEEPERIPA
jgi:cytochrome c biogenesis protein